ncbi:sodium/potassium/calcium exchanger 5-like [Sipha flava]|uniref:Sodium/potassium/calcium exchanger 5 n=1 Tax=Sipha flava TaxID=143950 RepID=A0A2S2R373_9HEMI|nr:sodium/potassium/calcium exchanger 5-like [Sipha flava]XP_025406688.1 sodium/potassium/calcium exchanger 5-like [Sipha flava]XP_025406690.1 sodium/potassium/calcium exchanger 5-like [Sipha flava]
MTKVYTYNIMNKINLRTKAYTVVFTIFVFILYCLKSLKPTANEYGIIHVGRVLLLTNDTAKKIESSLIEKIFIFEERTSTILFSSIVALYFFLFLGVVCNRYLVPCIHIISHRMKLSQDVAGASVMAAAVACPELFVNILATFFTEGDVGIGTVVGTGLFNILLVPGLCIIMANQKTIHLESWPITRDVLMYLLTISLLVWSLSDNKVYAYESFVLISVYLLYLLILSYSSYFEKIFKCISCQEDNVLEEHIESEPILSLNGISENGFLIHEHIVLPKWKDRICDKLLSLKEIVVWPIVLVLKVTVPSSNSSDRLFWVPITMFMCVFWIGCGSYIIVELITIIGNEFLIPDSVMGLTLLAIGMSVPEMVSSIAVARQGQGTMALCTAFSSSTFDVLICLGVPWFIKAMWFYKANSSASIDVHSRSLDDSAIAVMISTIGFMLLMCAKKFVLTKRLGGFLVSIWLLICSAMVYNEYATK